MTIAVPFRARCFSKSLISLNRSSCETFWRVTTTLILNGDVPLIRAATARSLVEACGDHQLALLTIALKDPTGYGRVIREKGAAGGAVLAIVEQKDATPEQKLISEIEELEELYGRLDGLLSLKNATTSIEV